MVQHNIVRRNTDQHDALHRTAGVIGINDRNRHLNVVILRVIIGDFLSLKAPDNLLRNDRLIIIQIIGIMVHLKIVIHNDHASIIDGGKQTDLRLNDIGF